MSTTAGLAIAGILALLLIVYVFAAGSPGHADSAPHCTSQQALNQVKGELFRRAAAMRNTNDPGFNSVGQYSVVRAGSRLVRRHHGGSGQVTCTGTLVLDLPPGAAVIGGRRSLSANLAYDLAPGGAGSTRLLSLGKADDIVMPLATISNAGAQQAQTNEVAPPANPPVAQMPPPPPPVQTVQQRPPAPPAPRPPAPRAAPVKKAPPPKPSPPARPKPSPPAAAKPRPAPPPANASAKPSFNCAKAHTSSERAICGNPGLAALDRQMSAEFYSALRAANPGQRSALENSRNRFLAYRNGCGSEACIADTYRGRMAEIADIMRGR